MEQSPEATRLQRRRLLQSLGGVGAIGFAGCLGGDENGDENGNGENGDGENGNGENGDADPWEDYEPSGESPERVEPGSEGIGREPPGDATVLWNGSDATLQGWEHTDGSDPEWNQTADYFEVSLGSGDIRTQEAFGDCHLHVEWRVPEEYEGHVDIEEGGDGQTPGNSGVFLMGTYEIQVLQSHDNPTYPSGHAGSYYYAGTEVGGVPLVLPINPPGEWNAYDIVWRRPRFDGDEVVRYPQLTVFFNGVAILNHFDVPSATSFTDVIDFQEAHPQDEDGNFLEEAPLHLQDHGANTDEVHYRNIWYRDLPEDPVEIDNPDDLPEYDSERGVWEERDEYDGYADAADPDHPDSPTQIEPGGPGTTGEPPEDAETVTEDELVLEPGDGDWESGVDVGDCQVHLEWRVPEDAAAEGPWRGDSGVMIGDYEIQILDNADNPTEPEEWAGAYAGEEPPHHDAVRDRGEWQHLDLVFQGPRDDASMGGPAQVTVLLNGVAVQTRLQIDEPNVDAGYDDLALRLQGPPEDGSEVRVRNAWIRSLVDEE